MDSRLVVRVVVNTFGYVNLTFGFNFNNGFANGRPSLPVTGHSGPFVQTIDASSQGRAYDEVGSELTSWPGCTA